MTDHFALERDRDGHVLRIMELGPIPFITELSDLRGDVI